MESEPAPQLTWATIFTALGVFCVMVAGGYAIIEGQFDSVQKSSTVTFENFSRQIQQNRSDIERIREEYFTVREEILLEDVISDIKKQIKTLEDGQRDLISHAAHSPVEAQQVVDLSHSIDARIATMQGQIDDINKQIAASIIPRSQQTPK
jgi:DNA-binding transcriptional regulator GbsR (MarR family)